MIEPIRAGPPHFPVPDVIVEISAPLVLYLLTDARCFIHAKSAEAVAANGIPALFFHTDLLVSEATQR